MIYVKDIIEKYDGVLIQGNISEILDNFSKDTRTINKGDIYVGIKGESFDGNSFFKDAFDKGAKCAILDTKCWTWEDLKKYHDKTIVFVDDTIKCLQFLARYKRSIYNIPVIAVTGSVGKTSTKDMITSVLKTEYKVLSTMGNNNNHIGLPLTILRLKDEEVMVLEMGMNNPGEISLLTDIARPTIAVITNIGTAHIGNLGSRENILKAKLEITEGLSGSLIINNDNDMLHNNQNIMKADSIITIGIDNQSDYMATNINSTLNKFTIEGNPIECSISSKVFIYNSLIAYTVGKLCKVKIENIAKGIKNFKPSGNRLEYKKTKNNIMVIDDTYNASLDSIKSSLEILKNTNSERKIAIIGDVLELGDYSEAIHKEIGKELLESNLDLIITIGEYTKYTDSYLKTNGYNKVYHFNREEDSHDFLANHLKPNDTVLIKGSHAMNLKNTAWYILANS